MENMIAEGKTKVIYSSTENNALVSIVSKNSITALNGKKMHEIENKGMISNQTTCSVFRYLKAAKISCAYEKQMDESSFSAKKCAMIPLEVVIRRVATGSFLKRNPTVKEGHRFSQPVIEFFFKDDAQDDPMISEEEIFIRKLLNFPELEKIKKEASQIFLLLEQAWKNKDVTLVDLKIEFGRHENSILLADVIDNDSWRLWPQNQKSRMVDKQIYRDIQEHTTHSLLNVVKNYEWVAQQVATFCDPVNGKVVFFLGSASDLSIAEKAQKTLSTFEVPSEIIILSAHKSTLALLNKVTELESQGIPLVYIAIAGRSNALGPVLEGNTTYPVINCPPLDTKFSGFDILSSLHLPSGMGCSTTISPDTAGLCAVKYLAQSNPILWAKLKGFKYEVASQYPVTLKREGASLDATS